MADIRTALIGFAQSQGRLPCPDTDRDGNENLTAGACTANVAFLPYGNLGVPPTDSWGQLYGYRLAAIFGRQASAGTLCNTGDNILGICDDGDVTIITRGDNPATGGTLEGKFQSNLATNAAALVISHGPNGECGTRPDGVQLAPSTGACPGSGVTAPDEFENVDGDAVFVSRLPSLERDPATCSDTDETVAFCEFDDLLLWLSPATVFGKMIEAGQLP